MIKQRSLTVGITLSLLWFSAVTFANNALLFDEFIVNSPLTLTHPVMIADVAAGNDKELVTLGVDKDNQSWLIVYRQLPNRQGFEISDQMMLDKSISRFDMSEYHEGKTQRIYFMSHQHLMVYVPSIGQTKSQLKTLGKINSLFLNDKPQFIAQDDFIAQLGAPGVDYIISTHFNGLTIYDDKGQALNKRQISIKPQISMNDNSAEFTKQQTYFIDVNFDNKKDIVVTGDGELIAYLQGNTFNDFTEHHIALNSSISGINWWNKRDASGDSLDQTNLVYRSLVKILDVNGDDVDDLVVKFTQSSGLLDRANNYEVFYGQRKNNQLTFNDKASTVITGEGTLTGLNLIDINNDKKLEVLLSGFDIGVSQIIGALLSGSIDQDVYLYQLDNQLTFPKDANVEKEVELNFSISSGQTGTPIIKLLDINGDGLKDLMLSSGEKTLKIYRGQRGKRLFEKRPQRYKTLLPKDGYVLISGDINNDGKDDVVFKYGRLDGDEKRHEFRVLLSR